jgi:hypothetical protein
VDWYCIIFDRINIHNFLAIKPIARKNSYKYLYCGLARFKIKKLNFTHTAFDDQTKAFTLFNLAGRSLQGFLKKKET